jgi:hypothetical protein
LSANTTAGFSCGKFTGTGDDDSTIGHGLNEAPQMWWIKRMSGGDTDWSVGHTGIGTYDQFLRLSGNGTVESGLWGADPTATVIHLGDPESTLAGHAEDYAMFAWHSVAGYSQFGYYFGNGSADGTFVNTGFRPMTIIVKTVNQSGQPWYCWDTMRSSGNGLWKQLFPNNDSVEASHPCDIYSNGFKFMDTDTGYNANEKRYIYAAFAETPFKYARAR